MSLDTTMTSLIEPSGSATPKRSNQYDSTDTSSQIPVPGPNDGPGKRGVNQDSPLLGKPESPGVIGSVFYDGPAGSPGSLESTMEDVLQISFSR